MSLSDGKQKAGILLIPGTGDGPDVFRSVAGQLKDRGFAAECIIPDGYGPGTKETDGDWKTWLRQSRDAVLAMKRQMGTVYAAGHSVGGILAILLGEEHLVDGVVSMASPLLFRQENKAGILEKIRFLLSGSGKRKQICRLSSMAGTRFTDLRCPLLILQGETDDMAGEESADFLYENSLSAYKEIFRLEGTMSVRLEEDAETVTEYLTSFFGKVQEMRESAETGTVIL